MVQQENSSAQKAKQLGKVVYKLAQPLLGKPIDPRDIPAAILTGGICILVYRMSIQLKFIKESWKE
jgi:hypothetical protein